MAKFNEGKIGGDIVGDIGNAALHQTAMDTRSFSTIKSPAIENCGIH